MATNVHCCRHIKNSRNNATGAEGHAWFSFLARADTQRQLKELDVKASKLMAVAQWLALAANMHKSEGFCLLW